MTSSIKNKQPIVRTARQKRAITALVKYRKLGVHELQKFAGQFNVPELMAGLARNGWEWRCELIDVLDRDGRKCRPGLYYLLPESLEVAREMVKEWEAATTQPKTISSTDPSTPE